VPPPPWYPPPLLLLLPLLLPPLLLLWRLKGGRGKGGGKSLAPPIEIQSKKVTQPLSRDRERV
jgi:hypothetical protein